MPKDALVPLGLAYLMLVVGLDLRLADFRALARVPSVVAAGLAAQMLGLPLLAFAIAVALRLPPELALGLVVVAAAPGGVTANFATSLLGGDVALSVVLTIVTSLAAALTVPAVVGLGFSVFAGESAAVALPAGRMAAMIVATTLLPLVLGGLLAARAPAFVGRARPFLRRIGIAVFAAVILVAVVGERAVIARHFGTIGLAVLALDLGAMALGYGLARAAGAEPGRARAVMVECGLQNVALALLVAGPVLGRPELGAVATVYAFVMNLTLVGLLAARRLSDVKSTRRAAV